MVKWSWVVCLYWHYFCVIISEFNLYSKKHQDALCMCQRRIPLPPSLALSFLSMKISKYIILFLLAFLLLVLLPYRDVMAGTISNSEWTLLYVDSEELVGEDGAAVNAFDGDVNTFWHTKKSYAGNRD